MLTYSPAEKEAIKRLLIEKLDKSFEVNQYGKGTPLWMDLAFVLDQFNQGSYYGTIQIKIQGTSVVDAKEVEVTHKLPERYENPPRLR